jgi:hypothetical protein
MISFTINTDASFSRKFRRGAGAYWIKGDNDFSVRGSFMFKQELHSSFIAELLTFERAFQEVNKVVNPDHRGAVVLFVNTDSMFVVNVLKGTANIKSHRNKHAVLAIQHAIKEYKVIPRHVKAHTDDLTEARSWVNDWCDRAAREEMGKELDFGVRNG